MAAKWPLGAYLSSTVRYNPFPHISWQESYRDIIHLHFQDYHRSHAFVPRLAFFCSFTFRHKRSRSYRLPYRSPNPFPEHRALPQFSQVNFFRIQVMFNVMLITPLFRPWLQFDHCFPVCYAQGLLGIVKTDPHFIANKPDNFFCIDFHTDRLFLTVMGFNVVGDAVQ